MRLVRDIHTHTNYSHGTATVAEMVEAAREKGLTGISITEHGHYHHYARGISMEDYREMKGQVEQMRQRYPDMQILFGVEANVVSMEGDIDFTPEEAEIFDVVNVGFHVLCHMKNLRGYLRIHLPFFLGYKLKWRRFQEISRRNCTQAMLNVLERYPIHMITHPMSNYRMDLNAVAEKCAQTGTLLEINNARGKLSAREVAQVLPTGVGFAVGSDAHSTDKVGACARSFAIIEESGVPLDRVENVEA